MQDATWDEPVTDQVTGSFVPGTSPPPLADLGIRFVARLIDWVIIFVANMVATAVFYALTAAGTTLDNEGGAIFGAGFALLFLWQFLIGALVPTAYFVGSQARFGRTAGKAITGLRLVRADNRPLTVQDVFKREWWHLLMFVPYLGPSLIVPIMAITVAFTISSGNGRGWPDQAANTGVVRQR